MATTASRNKTIILWKILLKILTMASAHSPDPNTSSTTPSTRLITALPTQHVDKSSISPLFSSSQ